VTISIHLFGALSFDDGRRTLGPRDFGGVKPKQLLELLLCEHGRPVPKDRLADGLWRKRLPQSVDATLETYVSVLRRSLGGRGRELVVTEPRAYRFDLDAVELDIDAFDARLAQAATADTAAARLALDEALALAARGELLADEPYADWVAPLRRHYNGKLLSALVAAADAALSLGDAESALTRADAALALDRFHEPAHRARILALYALDRQHDALDAYVHCRRLLDDELGLEPMPETRALQKAILAQSNLAGLIAPPTCSSPSRQENLLGRRRELDELEHEARAALGGHAALLLVEGEPRIGKTTVLDTIAARLAGVCVGRARCTPAEQGLPYVPIAHALRDALGVEIAIDVDAPAMVAFDALASIVREHAPLVLVLDDLEHADDATIATLAYLQRRCADVALVVLGAADASAPTLAKLRPTFRLRLEALRQDELDDPALHAQTGGHPQLLRAVLDENPAEAESLAARLLARCRARGPFAYRILLTACALDEPFDPEALAEALAVDPLALVEELEELCEHRLLVAEGDRFRFRYALLRDVLHCSLTPARRRLLHARLQRTVPMELAG